MVAGDCPCGASGNHRGPRICPGPALPNTLIAMQHALRRMRLRSPRHSRPMPGMRPSPRKGKLHPLKLRRLTSASLLLLVATVGCASSGTLPSPLSAAESHRWSDTRLGYTVGVEPYYSPGYSDALLTALQNTNLFVSVKPLDRYTTPPTLIASVEEPYYGGVATIPIWTVLSLGIVPTVVHESFGYDFSLRFSDDERHRYDVRYVCYSTTILGWIALFEALSPDVGLGDIERNERFRGRLALAILNTLPSVGK
jgi:hypothetical protein